MAFIVDNIISEGGLTGSTLNVSGATALGSVILTNQIKEANGGSIASSGTVNLGVVAGNYINITGTTTITSLGVTQSGTRVTVNFTGILTLTHNGTTLILPGAANIITAAGDTSTFVSLGSGNWRCVNYNRASGAALSGGVKATSADLNTGTNDTKFATSLALEGSKYLNQNSSKVSATASGVNTYTATIVPAITAYTNTQRFFIKFTSGSTTTSTLNLNGLGAKTINNNGVGLVPGDIIAGGVYLIAYDGTNFQLVTGKPSDISCRVTHSVAQSVPNSGFGYIMAFNSERYDTNNLHDTVTNNSRITIARAGKYLIGANIEWAVNLNGTRNVSILVSGLVVASTQLNGNATVASQQNINTVIDLLAGDYIQIFVYQTSGIALDISKSTPHKYTPEFWVQKIG